MHIHRIAVVITGNLLYHFDRALFGLLIPFLAPLFFPKQDPLYALVMMFVITPLTLVAKPLGAIVFGHLGDRIGTHKVLSITLLGMALKTGVMGLLPTYAQVGAWAPALLALTRLMVGFFSSGETTGGAIILFETIDPQKRGLMSALYDASGILGILLASFSVWTLHDIPHFWRILFVSGSLIGVMGWYIRRANGSKAPEQKTISFPLHVLWHHRKTVLRIATIAGFSYANYYLITYFMNGFLPLISPIQQSEAIALNTQLLLLDLLLLHFFGLACLKIRKELLILIAVVGIIFSCVPLFLLLKEVTLLKAAFVRTYFMIFGVVLAAPYHAWVYENTPTDHRYLIGAFSTAIGGRLLGSPIPPLGLWLYHKTGLIIAPALPLVVIGLLSLAVLLQKTSIKTKKALAHSTVN